MPPMYAAVLRKSSRAVHSSVGMDSAADPICDPIAPKDPEATPVFDESRGLQQDRPGRWREP